MPVLTFARVSFLLIFVVVVVRCQRTYYQHRARLLADTVKNTSYYPELRPAWNNSDITFVYVQFSLISLVNIDDVTQTFTASGSLNCLWQDDLLAWNPEDYGGTDLMYPKLGDIWKPELFLLNQIDGSDPFRETHSTLRIYYQGTVVWSPGGLFATSCNFDLTRYPFDEQVCSLQFMPRKYTAQELRFEILMGGDLETRFYFPSSEWELTNISTGIKTITVSGDRVDISAVKVTFKMKRRPASFMYAVVLPAMILSFLNTLVFMIPVGSGEKVSYGITVLLSQSVLMTTVSEMLPNSSLTLPLITVYIFTLLILAAVTVLVSILVVALSHLGQDVTAPISEDPTHTTDCGDSRGSSQELPSKTAVGEASAGNSSVPSGKKAGQDISGSRCGFAVLIKCDGKALSRWINNTAFVISVLAWTTLTAYFLGNIVTTE